MDWKWKSVTALGMAALLVCLIPMGTMMAAEEDEKAVQEIGADAVYDDESIPGDETADDKIGMAADQNASGEANADADQNAGGEANTDADGNISDEIDTGTDGNAGDEGSTYKNEDNSAALTSGITRGQSVKAAGIPESVKAPVIDIQWQGQNLKADGLGGKIEYVYINPNNQAVLCSADQDGQTVALSYYQEKVTGLNVEAKDAAQMESLSWISGSASIQISFLNDGNYVIYVKAEGADGQIAYARSVGIAVDTKVPEMTGIEDGKTYPEGTAFRVEDVNLKSVTVNGETVTPEADGSYLLSANSATCVIKAEDKAGNKTSCSITISGKDPGEEGNVISRNGTYALKAGVSYQLAAGSWKVGGDSAVYRGGSTFYVRTDGDYQFSRYIFP